MANSAFGCAALNVVGMPEPQKRTAESSTILRNAGGSCRCCASWNRRTAVTARPLFDHLLAQAQFGASVFWLRRLACLEAEQAAVEYWQVKRGGGSRGIVEIIAVKP